MARNRSYPQLAQLLIGQALFLSVETRVDANRVRVAAHNYGARHGLTFETHYDSGTGEIEIVRLPGARSDDEGVMLGRIDEPTRRTAPTRPQ